MKDHKLLVARNLTIENLGVLKTSIYNCVDEGMIDDDAHYYNEILDLIAEAESTKSWEELMEIIALAKTLEVDVSAWAAMRGQTSLGLEWPTGPDHA